ncbi:MAG: hypothetical protein K9G41_00020 [Flavobacteriales bacterium]|nr:hypothetical protein [Flavobacteriales bacterium]
MSFNLPHMRPLFVFAFFLSFNCVAQSPLEVYVKSEFYLEHLSEANQVYQELMDGKVGFALQLFIDDTVYGVENRLYIDTIFQSEGFRVAAMIDTFPTPGTGPPRYTTQVAYRKISEFDDGGFDFHRLWVGISWDKKFEVFGRRVVYSNRSIRTKKEWARLMFKYPTPDFLSKE